MLVPLPKKQLLNSWQCCKMISAMCSTHTSSFEQDFHKNKVKINSFQRALLSIGSATVSILDPHRGDMIATLGEVTGQDAMKFMKGKMENSKEGRQILRERPRINSKTVDLNKLSTYPENTLGGLYIKFLKDNNVTPDSRSTVQFVEDIELAYVIQRYREIHDLVHATLQMPTNMLGEVTVKWVEAIQTKLPMCIGGAIFGAARLKTKHRQLYLTKNLPWAIKTGLNSEFLLNIYFEKRWDQPLEEFYKEINVDILK